MAVLRASSSLAFQLEHRVHGHAEVHPIALPLKQLAGRTGGYLPPVAGRLHATRRDIVDGLAIRFHNPQRAVVEHLDAKPAFVHGVMMEAAE